VFFNLFFFDQKEWVFFVLFTKNLCSFRKSESFCVLRMTILLIQAYMMLNQNNGADFD